MSEQSCSLHMLIGMKQSLLGPSEITHSRSNANQKSPTAGRTFSFIPTWILREGFFSPPNLFTIKGWVLRNEHEASYLRIWFMGRHLPPPQHFPATAEKASWLCVTSSPQHRASALPNLVWASSNNNICLAAFQTHGQLSN